MATNPVTLDFSKAQPIQQQGPVTLDFSQAQHLDPTTSPIGRFFSSVKDRLQSPLSAGPMGQGDEQPDAKPLTKNGQPYDNGLDQMKDALKMAYSSALDAVHHPSELLSLVPSWDTVKQAITPKALQQIQAGDVAGGLGTASVDAINMMNSMGGAREPGVEPRPTPAPDVTADPNFSAKAVLSPRSQIPDVARNVPAVDPSTGLPAATGAAAAKPAGGVLPAVGKVARAASDIVNPDYTGMVSPRLAHAQRALGKLADAIEARRAAAAPVAEPPASMQPGSWSGPVKTPSTAAETPAEASPSGTAPSPVSAPTIASEDEIAQGLGYKDSKQAQSHLGPDVWKKTYNKLAQDDLTARQASTDTAAASVHESPTPPDVNTVIDQAIPPAGPTKGLNMKTKAEVDFYVQKGNVDAAKSAIQRAANTVSPANSDDAAFQEMGREDLDRSGRTAWQEKSAMRQAAESPAVSKTEMSAQQKAQASAEAAYQQTMQKEMPAFSRQGQPQSLAVDLPADEDLTSILQQSVDQANKGKKTASPAEMSPWGGRFSRPGQ